MLETLDLLMKTAGANVFQLPPLILHPFSSAQESSLLLENSRLAPAAHGFAPGEPKASEPADLRLLKGRYAELRMLFYIGKDISRWADQCAETANVCSQYADRKIRSETFAVLLVEQVPVHIKNKLEAWGVLDFRALFRRSYGLHAVFQQLPSFELLSPDFLRWYHRYLDQWYEQRLRDQLFESPDSKQFTFELYASGEYSSMLEKSWADDSARLS